jgi:MoxR-like ATPase
MNTKEIISKWNLTKGKEINSDSSSIQRLVNRAIKEFGEPVVLEVIEQTKETNIYTALGLINIANHMREKVGAEKIPQAETVKENLKGMTFSMLAEAISDMATSKVDIEELKAQVDDYIVSKYGPISRQVEYKLGDKVVIPASEPVHEEFETILKFVQADEPVMMVGPAGSGKNVLVSKVAKALDLNFYFSNAITEEYKLTGFIDAMGKYHETEFFRAFTKGGLFFLDEIDASIPETLVILNAAIANRYFDFPHLGKVNAHKSFRVIAAGNTYGHGATYQYVGRNQLDAASLNRFAVVEINYSEKIEKLLTQDKELLQFVRGFRKACDKAGVNHIVSYRELGRLDKMINQAGMEVEKALKTCLLKNLQDDDVRMVIGSLRVNNQYGDALKKAVKYSD